MTIEAREMIDEAISWHVRMQDADARLDAWESFSDWLAGDPARAVAYDRVALADDGLHRLAPAPRHAPVAPPAHRIAEHGRFRPWLGSLAVFAALAIAVLLWPRAAMPDLRIIATGPGQTRAIALKDGSRLELNGGTRIAVDMASARFARLDRGEATFFVRHDPGRPFVVQSGAHRLVDTGTVFNVAVTEAELNVAVADGSVLFDPEGARLPLAAGRTLRLDKTAKRIELGRMARQDVAGWRNGRLVYSDARIFTIAADLSRAVGRRVTVGPSLAARRFTGVIILDADEGATMRRAAALLDVQPRRNGEEWILAP